MNKAKLLKVVNPIFFVLIAAHFFLLFLSRAVDIGWEYKFHEFNGYLIGIFAAIHIYLNLPWFKSTYFRKKKADSTKPAVTKNAALQK
jgi:hypothetical protein